MEGDVPTTVHLKQVRPEFFWRYSKVGPIAAAADGVHRWVFQQQQVVCGSGKQLLLEVPRFSIVDRAEPTGAQYRRLESLRLLFNFGLLSEEGHGNVLLDRWDSILPPGPALLASRTSARPIS